MGRIPLGDLPESAFKPCFKRKPAAANILVPSRRRPAGLYNVLGIDSTASLQDIKRHYRRLSLANHPDRLPKDSSSQKRSAATRKQQEINEAFAVLGDAIQRQKYDEDYLHSAPSIPVTTRVRVHRQRLTRSERKVTDSLNTARRKLDRQSLARRAHKVPRMRRCAVESRSVTSRSRVISVNDAWVILRRTRGERAMDRRRGEFVAVPASRLVDG